MRTWGSLAFVVAPLMAFLAVGVLALLLRWAFSPGRSLVARRPRVGASTEYGLLVPVARPATVIQAEVVRRHLVARGVRATLAPTTDGPTVLVFPRDAAVAREILRTDPPPVG
ncbi:MAG TPA: hypothetical protein VI248_00755 [Kineosporiaceae bacterium]